MIYGEPFFMTVLDDKSSSQVGVKEKNGQKNFFNSNKNQLVKSVTRLSPIVMTLRLIPQVESSFVDGGRPMIFHTNTLLRPMVPPQRAGIPSQIVYGSCQKICCCQGGVQVEPFPKYYSWRSCDCDQPLFHCEQSLFWYKNLLV